MKHMHLLRSLWHSLSCLHNAICRPRTLSKRTSAGSTPDADVFCAPQLLSWVFSYDGVHATEPLAIISASAALAISGTLCSVMSAGSGFSHVLMHAR